MADKLVETLLEIGGLKPDTSDVPATVREELIRVFEAMPEPWKLLDRAQYLLEGVIERNGGVMCDNDVDTARYRFGNSADEWRVGELAEVARIISEVMGLIERKEKYNG
jgi:hypothetical protein